MESPKIRTLLKVASVGTTVRDFQHKKKILLLEVVVEVYLYATTR